MRKAIQYIDLFVARFVAVLMALLVVDVSWQVISRFIVDKPSVFTEEIALFLVLWITLLGAAYAYRKGVHLGLDIVINNLQAGQKKVAQKLADVVCLAFALIILVYGGWELVLLNIQLQQTSAALQIQIWLVYSVIPISGLLISLYALERLLFGADEMSEGAES